MFFVVISYTELVFVVSTGNRNTAVCRNTHAKIIAYIVGMGYPGSSHTITVSVQWAIELRNQQTNIKTWPPAFVYPVIHTCTLAIYITEPSPCPLSKKILKLRQGSNKRDLRGRM